MKKITFTFILLVTFCGKLSAEEQTFLALKSRVEGTGNIMLSTLFDREKTSFELIEKYGNLILPLARDTTQIIPSDILMVLSRAGADLRKITLISPSEVVVETDFMSETLSMIKDKALDELKLKSNLNETTVLFTQVPDDLPPKHTFKNMKVEIRDGSTPDTKTILANFLNEKGEVRSTSVIEAKLEALKTVLTANKNLYAGMSVTANDFAIEKKSLNEAEGTVASLAELGEGKWTLKDAIAIGDPLTRSAINMSATMQKGAVVTLLSGDKRFQVRALGRIKEVMDNGASVLAENIDSKKEVVGRPLNGNEVQIVY